MPRTIAAVDCGSNAIRLSIARVAPDGSLGIVHADRVAVRVGSHAFRGEALPEAVEEKLLQGLAGFRDALRRHGATRYRAVATEAYRCLPESHILLSRIFRETGLELELIPGEEEARLGFQALPGLEGRVFLLETGSGSLQFSLGRVGSPPDLARSLPLGPLRLRERYPSPGPLTPEVRAGVHRDLAGGLGLLGLVPPRDMKFLAAGGNMDSLILVTGREPLSALTRTEVSRLADSIGAVDEKSRESMGFTPDRADLVLHGALVLEAVMVHLDLPVVTHAGINLRDGILRGLADSL